MKWYSHDLVHKMGSDGVAMVWHTFEKGRTDKQGDLIALDEGTGETF